MSSGLSMSSVNKIKELASAREYGLALELVESQDLSKSLNPQFLRLCGEIYFYNDKFVEARRVLLMAHKLAPQAKRIMYSLMELYLKMGYKELAKTYFDMYLVDADEEAEETKQLRYIYGKANGATPEELVEYLGTTYNENIDYEWSYETFLVYTMLDRQQETLSLALEYTAHYTNAPHCYVVADVLEGNIDVKDVFYEKIQECEDDDPAQEESREEERKLLEAYNLRMNPPEPEIISMVDDREESIEFAAKRKRKKFLKEQLKEKEEMETDDSEAGSDEFADSDSDNETTTSEGGETTDEVTDESVDEADKKQGLFKRAFSKFRLKGQSKEDDVETEDENAESTTEDVEATSQASQDVEKADANSEVEAGTEYESDENASVTTEDVVDSAVAVEEEVQESVPEPAKENIEDVIDDGFEESSDSFFEEINDSFEEPEDEDLSDIEALLKSRESKNSAVVDDFDGDGFEAEMDSVDEFDKDSDKNAESQSDEQTSTRNSSIVFEDADFADEDDDDIPVDDFSSDDGDDEFGKMHTGDEEDYSRVFVGEVEAEEYKSAEDIYNDVERTFADDEEESFEAVEEVEETYEEPVEEAVEEVEETYEEPVEEAVEEVEETYEEPVEEAVEEVEETYEEPAEEAYEEPVEEAVEEVEETYEEPVEETVEEVEGTYEEPVEEAVEDVEETYEEPVEEAVEEVEETYEEPVEETVEEVEDIDEFIGGKSDEIEKTISASAAAYKQPEEATRETAYTSDAKKYEDIVNAPWKSAPKSSLDFPVFRSSLFPEYHDNSTTKAETPIANKDIQEQEKKLQENLLKEEQIQREAEALLASLGIDISGGSAKSTPTLEKTISENTPEPKEEPIVAPMKEASFIKKEPSRDELKASLKIDSVKRNLLSKLKESR